MRTQLLSSYRKISIPKWQKVIGRKYSIQSEENIHNSTFKSLSIPTQNVSDFCLSRFDRWTNLPALVCGASGKQFSYGDVKSLSRQFGSQLLDNGLKPGDKIAVIIPNCLEFGPILFGATGVGVTVVPISPLLTAPEVARVLAIADPKLIITCDPLIPLIDAAQKATSSNLPIVTVTDNSISKATPFTEFVANDGSLFDTKPSFDVATNLAILPFSSGTTGPPKGVMLTHQNLTSVMCLFNDKDSGCSLLPLLPGDPQPIAISVIPNFHIFGLACNVMQPLTVGCQMLTLPKFEPASFISSLEKYQPTHFNIVPPLVAMLALSPAITREKHLSRAQMISSGGSPISALIINKLRDKLGSDSCEIKEGYGMTEAPVVTRTINPRPMEKHASVGKLVCNNTAKVVDIDTGISLGPNKPGELFIKGPQVMVGYFKNKAATDEAFKDGWFRTGDVLYYDDDGYFYVVDRIKDMIKVKGYQVSPTEIEDVIRTVPGVADVAVIGVEDEIAGELPKAFIVRASEEVNEEQIHLFLEDKLAKYKKLSGGIVFLQELPKSPTGKVLRKELRNISVC